MGLERIKKILFPKYFTNFKPMSYKESLRILESTGEDFMERYKELMKINHPDRGGSPFVSMKINEAKDYLKAFHQP